MADQNSTTEMQYRPEEVQREFNIKSAAYYERIKFLGIKAHKDKGGKVYLNDFQFQRMKWLDSHIQETGEMDGFVDSESGELGSLNRLICLPPLSKKTRKRFHLTMRMSYRDSSALPPN